MDEDEDNNSNESSKGPSIDDAFSALETAVEWYEQQSECCPTQLLLLKRIRDLASEKRRERHVRFRKHKVRENMTRKRENEAPLEQESRRESNRLRRARLRALETEQEQEPRRKSNCLQMMQRRISETTKDREGKPEYQRNVRRSSRMAVWER
ncbi:uncharacterized protein TNCV_4249041 [Trichonephila clavipes]|nr:uncharacterized protein TNCV_4249041 [Trichonephila clavipes]